jgi:hypothetical protein
VRGAVQANRLKRGGKYEKEEDGLMDELERKRGCVKNVEA